MPFPPTAGPPAADPVAPPVQPMPQAPQPVQVPATRTGMAWMALGTARIAQLRRLVRRQRN